jgi:hypothetical protein
VADYVTTATELHAPTGRAMDIELITRDVIDSFTHLGSRRVLAGSFPNDAAYLRLGLARAVAQPPAR